MTQKLNGFVIAALLAVVSLSAGCAADVSHRGPVRGEATVEGDRTSEREQNRSRSSDSDSTSGSVSGSGSGSFSGSGTVR